MPLQTSGQISLGNIATEFGGAAPHQLSEYYGAAGGIPASGAISIGNFYGAASYPSWDYNPHTQTWSTYNTSGSIVQNSTQVYLSGASYNGGMRGSAVSASGFLALQSPWTLEATCNRDGVNSSPFPNYSVGITRETSANATQMNNAGAYGMFSTTVGNAYGCYYSIRNSDNSTATSGSLSSTYAFAGATHKIVFDPSTFNLQIHGRANGGSTFTLLVNYTYPTAQKTAWLNSYVNTNQHITTGMRSNGDGWRNVRWYTN